MERAEPPRSVTIERTHWQRMREHASAALPEEACGILAGRGERCVSVITLNNVLHSPTQYAAAPEELFQAFAALERETMELLAIFHSHPRGEAQPSATDVANAYYPNSAQLILAPHDDDWMCRAFTIERGVVSAIPLHIL